VSEFLHQYAFLVVPIIKVAILVLVVLTVDAYLTWLERKVIAHIQARWGPHRVGPHGLMQPLADGLKFIFKEDPMPANVDKPAYFIAPFVALMLALTSLAVIPFGPQKFTLWGYESSLGIADVNISLLVLFAITALGVYGVALAGWASNNKYSLLGGLRSSAQMISYELALTLSVVGVLLIAGSFSLREIVEQRAPQTLVSSVGTCWALARASVLRKSLDFSASSSRLLRKQTACHSIWRKRNRNSSRVFTLNTPA